MAALAALRPRLSRRSVSGPDRGEYFRAMIGFLIMLVSLVFVLSVVVTVHELGHYWAARACGVA
ncbi:MAG: site-2 protease family protein, partial [Caulobacter sp.]